MEKELHGEVWLSRLFAWLELSDDVQLDLYESSFGRWSQSCVFLQTVNVFLHGECLFTFPLRVAGKSLQVVYPILASWPSTDSTLTRGQVLCPGLLGVRSPGYCRGSWR